MILLLLLATVVALSPVLFADFIRLDDYSHLFENPQLRRMSVSGLATLWTKSYFNLYIPITYSVWWALAMIGSLFGELRHNARGYSIPSISRSTLRTSRSSSCSCEGWYESPARTPHPTATRLMVASR